MDYNNISVYKFFANLLWGEDRVLCFLCTRRLMPLPFRSWKRVFFNWLRPQFTVGFVRRSEDGEPLETENCSNPECESCAKGYGLAVVFEITVCQPCGEWANLNPVVGEMLAKARLASIQSGNQDESGNS